jgi:hypothetical protein
VLQVRIVERDNKENPGILGKFWGLTRMLVTYLYLLVLYANNIYMKNNTKRITFWN